LSEIVEEALSTIFKRKASQCFSKHWEAFLLLLSSAKKREIGMKSNHILKQKIGTRITIAFQFFVS